MSDKKYNFQEFPISSWAIENRITIYLLTIVIAIAGMVSYSVIPKENFPEVQWPVIYVSTPYPGTSPEDVENLVTRKIEKELNGIEGVKEINSTSIQDFSSVFVEFETDVDLDEAKREVDDAVNRAKNELPNDLPNDPQVVDINLSEIPIMFLNVSGPFDNVTLKRYGEDLQEEIEKRLRKEVLRIDLVGALEREFQVNVDLYKMEAASISMGNIESAIANENVIISGGELDVANQKVAVRLNGEFQNVDDLRDIVVRGSKGNSVYLRDVAEVVDGFEERESYARLNGQPVLTLNVIKKAGENLIETAAQIKDIVVELQEERYPEALTITISGDQSIMTLNTLNELTNTIIIGFILVTLVLTFFMGVRDALFVGLAVPLASFIAFATLPVLGYTMNLIVLFSFILAMGIVVDNAIVVIENTHRIFNDENLPIVPAAKKAAGEVIAPVFSGTLTTIAPFLPLLFWKGAVGEFMKFLPVVMIITLFASLFVAYVINPVFAVSFMKRDTESKVNHKKIGFYLGAMLVLGILGHVFEVPAFGNFLFFMLLFVAFNAYVMRHAVRYFQRRIIPAVKDAYGNLLRWCLTSWHPYAVLTGTVLLLLVSFAAFNNSNVKIVQFPKADPNFVYVYNELPTGTDIEVTDSITTILEDRVYEIIEQDNPIVKSVITNVAIGAGDANSFDQSSSMPNKGKVTVEFVSAKERGGVSTQKILEDIRANMKGIPGAKITVEQDEGGPPGGAPVQIELKSENFGKLVAVSEDLFGYLDSLNVVGVEQLKWDVDERRPELMIDINREKASELGISSGQIGMAIRTALFGKEVSQFRDNEDEYPIQLRLQERFRDNISSLLDMRISYMDQANGSFKSVPISAVADFEMSSAYGGINRTDLKKSVTITSNVLSEFNVNDVNAEIKYYVDKFQAQGRLDREVDLKIGGETEDQAKEGAFLALAFGASIILIFMILVTQFNSFSNVLIILFQVFLSVTGVLLGYALSGKEFSVILSGVALVTLAGIVVNNGIILLDFIQILRKQGSSLKEAVIEGGRVRFTPVLLTASSTVLGLVPLALSLNINFNTLLSDLDPQIFFGGDSAAFWEPFAFTVIYGLSFATVITLVVVPVMYYLTKQLEAWMKEKWFKDVDSEEASQDVTPAQTAS
jgi:multidrug efflux pump